MSSSINALGGYVVLAAISVVFVGLVWLTEKRGRSILRKWAFANGFDLLKTKRALHCGAFPLWTIGKGQIVYSITVRDQQGCQRFGWVRCGSFLGGVLFSEKADVIWRR
jgi:hypothetical protein